MSKTIQDIIKSVSKTTGQQIQILDDIEYDENLQVIPSGIHEIDFNLLEVGGVARGRLTEFSGDFSSGKSTLTYMIAANCQKMPGNLGDEGVVAIFDVEQCLQDSFSKKWLELQGVDRTKLICITDIIAEDILYKAHELCKEGVDLIIIDSVAAMVARADSLEHVKAGKKAVDQLSPGYGHLAGALSLGLRQLNKVAKANNTAVIFVNQLRDKLGSIGFAPQDSTPGGRALKFACSVRLKLIKAGELKDGDTKIGVMVKGYVAKSKISTPLRRSGTDTNGYVSIRFDGKKADQLTSLVDSALLLDLITRKGNTYTFAGIKVAGRDKFEAAIRENEEVEKSLIELMQSNKNIVYSEDELTDIGDGD